jgi:hypothetical protein
MKTDSSIKCWNPIGIEEWIEKAQNNDLYPCISLRNMKINSRRCYLYD